MERLNHRNYDLETFRGDLTGGITSAVVTLPLTLAFGVASGLGAAAGLYGAIAVGFFAAVFGGTRAQLSAPTPPTTVAMAVILTSHASNLGEAMAVVILGGLFQVLMGISGIGRFVAYTPYVVVSGFMSGVGIIMITTQILPILGAPAVPGGTVGAIRALPAAVDDINLSAVIITAATLSLVLVWPHRLARFVPAPLPAMVAVTLLGVLWLNDAPVIGPVPAGLPDVRLPRPFADFLAGILQPAIILALLSSVNSLLASLVSDSLTGARHNPNRELVGQGIGNMTAGLFGGLHGAGSIMGTAINIRAGGRTRVSGALSAMILLVVLLSLSQYVELVPRAVLAGLLLKIGWDFIDWHLLTHAHRIRREDLVVLLITLSLTVLVDLMTGMAIGLITAGMVHARQLERLEMDNVMSVPLPDPMSFPDRKEASEGGLNRAPVGLVTLRGRFTVASSHKLVGAISEDIRDHEVIILDFSEATYLDDSAAMVIKQLMDVAREEQTELIVVGVPDAVGPTLQALSVFRRVPENQIVSTLDEARRMAADLLDR